MDFSIRLSWYKSFNESTWKHLSGLLVQNEKQVNNLSTTSFLDPVCCKNCKQNHRVHQTHSSMWQEKCKTLEVEKLLSTGVEVLKNCYSEVAEHLSDCIQLWWSLQQFFCNDWFNSDLAKCLQSSEVQWYRLSCVTTYKLKCFKFDCPFFRLSGARNDSSVTFIFVLLLEILWECLHRRLHLTPVSLTF